MGYHINIDGVVIEFVKNGEPVAPEGRGEIVVTNLVNRAMPLIRYELCDEGILQYDKCSCGRPLPMLKMLEGRKDDFLTTIEGRVISLLIFFPYPFDDLEGIKHFRVIQERRDKLTIQLVAPEGFLKEQVSEKATQEIKRVFGEGMQVEFQLLEKIERDSSGKLRKIISRVPVNLNG